MDGAVRVADDIGEVVLAIEPTRDASCLPARVHSLVGGHLDLGDALAQPLIGVPAGKGIALTRCV